MGAVKHLNLAVTYSCNSRCIHCHIWKRRPEGELSVQEIARLIVQSPVLSSLQTVGITGGEPFLRADLLEICKAFFRHHPALSLSIATHGMNQKRIAAAAMRIHDLSRDGWFGMSVSVDGLERLHDQQRGISGAFRKSLETVEYVHEKGIPVTLSFTVTPHNFEDLFPVYDLARQLDVGFTARFAQSSFYYGNEDKGFNWDDRLLNRATVELDRVVRSILLTTDLAQKHLDPYLYFLTRATEFQKLGKRITPCLSGTHSLYIDSMGSVYPCVMLDEPLGLLRERSLEDIYSGPHAQRVRDSIVREICSCWTECETTTSLQAIPGLLDWDPRELLPHYGIRLESIDGVLHARSVD